MIEGVQADMIAAKEKMDTEKERQEQALHKKLTERKKAKMAEMVGLFLYKSGAYYWDCIWINSVWMKLQCQFISIFLFISV